jgi:hypothetical protein
VTFSSQGIRFVQQQIAAGELMREQLQGSVLVLQGQQPEATAVLGHMEPFHAFNLLFALMTVNPPEPVIWSLTAGH